MATNRSLYGGTWLALGCSLLVSCSASSPVSAVEAVGPIALGAVQGNTEDQDGPRQTVVIDSEISSWGMQLQGIELAGAQQDLVRSKLDLVVIEPMTTVKGTEAFPIKELVARLHASAGGTAEKKQVWAYLNVGQAEDYRTYWGANWVAPTEEGPGEPAFILGLDPDGWPGNYPVAFWEPEWRRTLFGGPGAQLDQILAAGFDGVYMDWILAASWDPVVAAAKKAGKDPVAEMERLLGEMRAYAHKRRPGFLMIAQNAAWLVEDRPSLRKVIDGVAHEDLSFRGEAADTWADPKSGGIQTDAAESRELARLLGVLKGQGLVTLTIDYAVKDADRQAAIKASRAAGAVPFVSRTALDRLPDYVL